MIERADIRQSVVGKSKGSQSKKVQNSYRALRDKGACLLSVKILPCNSDFIGLLRKELTMTIEIVTKASNGIFLIFLIDF